MQWFRIIKKEKLAKIKGKKHWVIMSRSKTARSEKQTKPKKDAKDASTQVASLQQFIKDKDGNRKQGVQKAARLLLALGQMQASEVIKRLSGSEIESVMHEMAQIKYITSEERVQLLSEFGEMAAEENVLHHGGIDEVRKFLEQGLGEDAAENIIRKIDQHDLREDFRFLEGIEPATLASALSQEHSQTVAVALIYLKSKIAAEVMKHFPKDVRTEIALRIAKTTKIAPEALERTGRVLRDKFERRNPQENHSDIGGVQSLADILNHMDRNEENEILSSMESVSMPEVIQQVKERLYTFEELLSLTQQEMRLLISKIDDDFVLSTALRGTGEEIRRHFFNAMSQNRAEDVFDEIERRGPLPVKEIYESRSYVVSIARQLDEEGVIAVKKNKEEFI